jgi:two-component system sensor histidine kinase RegB
LSHATQLGPPWIGKGARPDESGLFSGGFKQGLRLLAFLRVWSPIAQMLTLFVVTRQYGVHVPIEPVAALLVAEAMVAVATLIYLRQARHITALELMLQAHLDILMFAAMLYLTGGATNPFAPLFVLPMAVVASTLGTRHVWITVGSTMAAYVFLRYVHVPMYHPAGETQVHELHENGMVINYMFTAVLLAVFCSYMRSALSSHERLLADARATQMRNESVLAIGALAAGYAHELSSPLSTMAVVVSELQRERVADQTLQQDLRLLNEQVSACKRIVSNLAISGGRRRAESAAAIGADHFIESIVEQVRALHPGATITASLDRGTAAPQIVAEETLRQAITNLVTNGAHASPCDVHVSASWTADHLHVAVRDRGPGFSAEVLDRLGHPMESTRQDSGGLGLGLVLSVVTLELLGGRLELSNPPGGGALAEIHVPLHSILLHN